MKHLLFDRCFTSLRVAIHSQEGIASSLFRESQGSNWSLSLFSYTTHIFKTMGISHRTAPYASSLLWTRRTQSCLCCSRLSPQLQGQLVSSHIQSQGIWSKPIISWFSLDQRAKGIQSKIPGSVILSKLYSFCDSDFQYVKHRIITTHFHFESQFSLTR